MVASMRKVWKCNLFWGECTAFCQPLDVGVENPLKDKLRNQWETWMAEEEMMLNKMATYMPRGNRIDSRTMGPCG